MIGGDFENWEDLIVRARGFAPESCWDAQVVQAVEAIKDYDRLTRLRLQAANRCIGGGDAVVLVPEIPWPILAPMIEHALQAEIQRRIRERLALNPAGIPVEVHAEWREFLDLAAAFKQFAQGAATYREVAAGRHVGNGRVAKQLLRAARIRRDIALQDVARGVEPNDVSGDIAEELEACGCAAEICERGLPGADEQAARYITARLLGQGVAVNLAEAMDALAQQVECFRVWGVLLG
ncbi:MAG: hypothetical protein JW990_06895 [Thermoleophilia bacterium]|nr:hypothetical protein [Thermoleophilia bacterium]